MTGQELARLAYQAVGATGHLDFAKKIGLKGDSRAKRVKRWLEDGNDPGYEGTLLLLRAAGLLREEAAAAEASSVPAPGSPEELVVRLMASVESGFAKLDRRLARLEKRQAAPANPGLPRERRVS